MQLSLTCIQKKYFLSASLNCKRKTLPVVHWGTFLNSASFGKIINSYKNNDFFECFFANYLIAGPGVGWLNGNQLVSAKNHSHSTLSQYQLISDFPNFYGECRPHYTLLFVKKRKREILRLRQIWKIEFISKIFVLIPPTFEIRDQEKMIRNAKQSLKA